VFTSVAWFFMASTRDAGASMHHTVLLWPFPQLFVAVTIAAIRWKWVVAAICFVLFAWNLLVVNQYLSQFERNGAENVYTDALYPLSAAIAEVTGQTVYTLDWGIQFPLDVLHNGHLNFKNGQDPFQTDTPTDGEKDIAGRIFADRNALFIAHVDKRENFPGTHHRFLEAANAAGCREENVRIIHDSNSRPVFEVFQLACR
jgi:hypothetical protein